MKPVNLMIQNWEMGTAIIIFFAVFCVAISIIIYSMVQSGKNKKENEKEK